MRHIYFPKSKLASRDVYVVLMFHDQSVVGANVFTRYDLRLYFYRSGAFPQVINKSGF